MFNNSQTYSDIWQLCLNRIKEQTSAEEFAKWFQPIVPLEFDGTTLRLRVPNASYVYQIEKNYIPFLRPIISQLYGQQTRLHYAVPKAEAPKLDTETDSTAISRFATQNDTANIKNPFIIPGLKGCESTRSSIRTTPSRPSSRGSATGWRGRPACRWR